MNHHFTNNNQSNQLEQNSGSVISKLALILVLLFIFSIPWGNALWDGLTRIIGAIAFGVAIISFISHGTHSKYSFFHIFIAFYGVWLLLTLMWSPTIDIGSDFVFTIIQLLLIPFLLTLIADSPAKLLLVYQSYVLGTVIGSSIIIYNFITGIESSYYGRYGIPNFDVDGLAVMLTIAIPIAAYLATKSISRWLKIINVLSIPMIVYAVFLTGTRTASIVAVIGIIYWLFTHRKSSFVTKTTFITIFVITVATVFTLAPQKSIDRILSTGKSISSGTLNNRTVIWRASIEQWKKAPIVGSGIGSLYYVLSPSHVEYDGAHNTYLHMLTENGIIGLLLYLLIIMNVLYLILPTPLSEKAFLISLLMVILVSQLTLHTHLLKETWFVLTMLAIHAHSAGKRTTQNVV